MTIVHELRSEGGTGQLRSSCGFFVSNTRETPLGSSGPPAQQACPRLRIEI